MRAACCNASKQDVLLLFSPFVKNRDCSYVSLAIQRKHRHAKLQTHTVSLLCHSSPLCPSSPGDFSERLQRNCIHGRQNLRRGLSFNLARRPHLHPSGGCVCSPRLGETSGAAQKAHAVRTRHRACTEAISHVPSGHAVGPALREKSASQCTLRRCQDQPSSVHTGDQRHGVRRRHRAWTSDRLC